MKARVTVRLRPSILDPQGKAIEGALHGLGMPEIVSVRQGKVFDIELAAEDRAAALAILEQACRNLLANTVIEDYRIEIL